jgi:acetylornithine/succinyldiaminopimelate/putrescine aminotransferase
MSFDLPALLAQRAGQGYELQDQYLKPNLSRMLRVIGFDKVYEKAEGGYLYDSDGNRYADFLTGFGVFGMGRNHPVIRKALHDLLDREVADLVQFDCALLPGLLAERLLAKVPGMDRAYFSNSGTEAVETALKFARYATGKPRVLYCDHAFHGLTLGSLSVNGSAEFRQGFDPLLPDSCIPLGDLDALARELRKGDVAALLVEPIQGKGVHLSPPGFLAAAAKLPGSAGPGGSSPTSTKTCSRTSSQSPRRCPAASSRSAPRWPRTGSSRRSTPRWTGRSCTTRRSATTRRR